MDKEQAKFILQSFRPDGADAADTDFAEALQLAVEDRELGEWLADERATDAAFAAVAGGVAGKGGIFNVERRSNIDVDRAAAPDGGVVGYHTVLHPRRTRKAVDGPTAGCGVIPNHCAVPEAGFRVGEVNGAPAPAGRLVVRHHTVFHARRAVVAMDGPAIAVIPVANGHPP